ncbi:MAG: chloride channel protein [Ignavibacteria bacterium]|nr:chloride channel protein [Ignavibacteria bacterium]
MKLTDFEKVNLKLQQSENLYMIFLAIIIGTLAGFAAVFIRILIEEISSISFPGDKTLLENLIAIPWYYKLLVPVIGGVIVGPMVYFFAPEAKGHGVPEVMASMIQKGGRIRPRVALIKALASSVTIGTGGAAGREGPIIQIGASIGSTVGQILNFPTRRIKTLVGCGAAAGIAAAFNAPIAGILFALELLLMDFSAEKLIPIAISSVISTTISRNIEGNFAAFITPQYSLVSPYELLFYVILGLFAGIISYLFIKTLYFSEELFDEKIKIPGYFKPAIGGLLLGCIGIFFPQVLGMSYDSMNLALQGKVLIMSSLILIFAKIIATSVTLGSGSSGGIFAPSLFMGAMLGSMFGGVINNFFPDISANSGAYALVAMAGLVAGTTRAPITAFIIVFEMTANYQIILPLVIVCVISTLISAKLSRESIYTLKLVLKNINLQDGVETNVMESLLVKDIYKKNIDSVDTLNNLEDILDKSIRNSNQVLPVTNSNGLYEGIISITEFLLLFKNREQLNELIIAKDIMNTKVIPLVPEDNCHNAIDRMKTYNIDGIPIVNNHNDRKLIGILWASDIHSQYLKEIERLELITKLTSSIKVKDKESQVTFQIGYIATEIKVPKNFIGKKISELDIRKQFGVEILAVKTIYKGKESFIAFPKSDYIFNNSDKITIAGLAKNVNILKNN